MAPLSRSSVAPLGRSVTALELTMHLRPGVPTRALRYERLGRVRRLFRRRITETARGIDAGSPGPLQLLADRASADGDTRGGLPPFLAGGGKRQDFSDLGRGQPLCRQLASPAQERARYRGCPDANDVAQPEWLQGRCPPAREGARTGSCRPIRYAVTVGFAGPDRLLRGWDAGRHAALLQCLSGRGAKHSEVWSALGAWFRG